MHPGFSTVGYGDVSPITTEGRLIAVGPMFVDIGFIGVFTATITSYLLDTGRRTEEEASIDARLTRIETKLDALMQQRPLDVRSVSSGAVLPAPLRLLADAWPDLSDARTSLPRVRETRGRAPIYDLGPCGTGGLDAERRHDTQELLKALGPGKPPRD